MPARDLGNRNPETSLEKKLKKARLRHTTQASEHQSLNIGLCYIGHLSGVTCAMCFSCYFQLTTTARHGGRIARWSGSIITAWRFWKVASSELPMPGRLRRASGRLCPASIICKRGIQIQSVLFSGQPHQAALSHVVRRQRDHGAWDGLVWWCFPVRRGIFHMTHFSLSGRVRVSGA